MKRSVKVQRGWRVLLGTAVLTAVLATGLLTDAFLVVSYAASAGKVTATSANIRKEPSTQSESVSGVTKDTVISIKGQTTGSDGYTWYQIEVDGASGYVRSDLVEITDGSTPATIVPSTGTTGGGSTPTTSSPDENLVAVTALEPVSASVSGGSPVRVRQNASTTSRIVTTAQSGLALTVTGQATGTDGNQWYQVEYIANGSEVKGFVRSDYVAVDGELIPAGTAAPGEDPTPTPDVTPQTPVQVTKDWDTYYEDGKWHLIDNISGKSYDPQGMIDSVETNTQTLSKELAKNKKQQVIIIVLVILLIGMAAAISYLIFRIKDMSDAAYFSAVEKETIRRRTADRPSGSGQKVTHTVGADKRPAGSGNGQRPSGSGSGQRPAGSGNGQRPSGSGSGQRPAGSGNGQRPTGSGSGQRPAGSGNGQRPAGNGNGQRPSGNGQRPAGNGNGQRPSGNGQRPAGSGQRSGENNAGGGRSQSNPSESAQEDDRRVPEQVNVVESAPEKQEETVKKNPKWKSRNFMADDEEFEFKFLDWDDKEGQ